jgi:nicotinamidase-related amidase
VLRSLHVDHLVLFGVRTAGVVLSTVRDAADRDFKITVLGDLCSDANADAHAALLRHVLPIQSEVVDSKVFLDSLAA